MGFYLTEQATDLADEISPAGHPRLGAKKPLGAPFLHPILSTKYWDENTGLGNWGWRYYHPDLGRWLSKDPLGEEGGLNIYAIVDNDPIDLVDVAGLGWIQKIKAACETAKRARLLVEMAEKLGQLERKTKSLSLNAAKHRQKLQEYLANPDKFDNLGKLKNAPNAEVRQKIIDGRRKHLEGEISNWEQQIREAQKEIAEIKAAKKVVVSCACSILIPHSMELIDYEKEGIDVTTGQFISGAALDLGSVIDPGVLDFIEWLSQ
jgi:RHS repeat-associated protein